MLMDLAPRHLLVIVQERKDFRIFELLAPVQEIKFHHEGQPGNLCAQRFGQLYAGVGGTAGGQQVVYDNHLLPGLDGIFMDLQRIQAVFQLIAPLDSLRRKFAGFADRNKAGVQTVGQSRTKDETARFDGQDRIDLGVEVMLGKRVDERGKAHLVLEQGGDVVEQDAFLGEVRDLANQRLQMFAIRATWLRHRFHHAPSMRNVVRSGMASAGDSFTSSTRAARGPSCSLLRKAVCCSLLPMASTSTVPSMLFLTHPARPSWRAS